MTGSFDEAGHFREVASVEQLRESAGVLRYEDAVDDVEDAVGSHHIAGDDLLAVDVEFAFEVVLQQQRRAQQRRRARPTLDHRRADDVAQNVMFHHTCNATLQHYNKVRLDYLG